MKSSESRITWRMRGTEHPALKVFVERIGDEAVLAQVSIRSEARGFKLCHVDDRQKPEDELRIVSTGELRELAQFTEPGVFRPLKSAPNLRRGWRWLGSDARELGLALNHLYPGAVVDWFCAQSDAPPVTHYRDFTARQSGMYRITAKLDDARAAGMIRACCHQKFCLKRRLWTVEGLEPESATADLEIPCLEPCAILLEFARKAMRIEQEEGVGLELKPSEAATVMAALEIALDHPTKRLREADFGVPENPRRLQLVLEKLRAQAAKDPGKPESKR